MLFTGIMITSNGPLVLEDNVRFGDPETQSLIPLLSKEADLSRICLSCVKGMLRAETIDVQDGYACNVVVASTGYPSEPRSGDEITISPRPPGQCFSPLLHLADHSR